MPPRPPNSSSRNAKAEENAEPREPENEKRRSEGARRGTGVCRHEGHDAGGTWALPAVTDGPLPRPPISSPAPGPRQRHPPHRPAQEDPEAPRGEAAPQGGLTAQGARGIPPSRDGVPRPAPRDDPPQHGADTRPALGPAWHRHSPICTKREQGSLGSSFSGHTARPRPSCTRGSPRPGSPAPERP